MLGLPVHAYPDDEPRADALAQRVRELEAVFDPPFFDLRYQGKHAEGTCLQCDAERVLAARSICT